MRTFVRRSSVLLVTLGAVLLLPAGSAHADDPVQCVKDVRDALLGTLDHDLCGVVGPPIG